MPGFKLLNAKPGLPFAWMSLSFLLLLGALSTVIDLVHLPTREMLRANETGQRAVIDPATGMVSLSALKPKDSKEFDVADAPAEPAAEEKPSEKTTEEKPADEPKPTAEEPTAAVNSPAEKAPDGLPALRTTPTATTLPEVPNSDSHLVAAPAPEVSETKDGHILPKRNGTATPAVIYARRFNRTPEQHLLSLVILDAGLSAQSLPIIMGLPKDVTVAFSPYAVNATAHIATIRSAGFEVWGMLPAMGAHYPQDDPGPLGLVSSLPRDEVIRRLHAILVTTLGSAGVVLPPDEILTNKPEAFSPVIAEIDARGLNVLATNPQRTASQVSGTAQMQSTVRRADMMLDPVPDEALIEKKLGELAVTLKTKDSVVVVASARPQTLLILQKWFKDHPLSEPATLAPLSAQWLPKEVAKPAEEEKSEGGHGEKKEEKKAEPEKKPEAKSEKKSSEHH